MPQQKTKDNDVKLIDFGQFEKRFIEYTAEADTYEEAYRMAEEDYRRVFGRRKYSSYASFRVVRSRKMKRR